MSGFLGCSSVNSLPLTVDVTEPQVQIESSEVFRALVTADVVYLGEQHDSAADHAAQLDIIAALYAEDANMAIALEMFQRPFQSAIDAYLAGDISEAELIRQSEYDQRWGFPWEFYAPILRFAQAHQLPVVALNAPSEISRKVARQGLDSLEGEDLRYIPPIADIDTQNEAYRELVRSPFRAHGSHGTFNFENFFAAQVLWDETMAMTVAEFRQANPDTQIIVLAGQGHVVYGYGIPDRVAQRLGQGLEQQIVLLNPHETLEQEDAEDRPIADVLWYSVPQEP